MAGIFVTAARFPTSIEAHLARNHLAEHGVDAWVTNDAIADMAWHFITAIGWVKVLVPAGQHDRAKALLGEAVAIPSSVRGLEDEGSIAWYTSLWLDEEVPSGAGEGQARKRLADRAILAALGSTCLPSAFPAIPFAAWLLWRAAIPPGKLPPRTWCLLGLTAVVFAPNFAFFIVVVTGTLLLLALDNSQWYYVMDLAWSIWRQIERILW